MADLAAASFSFFSSLSLSLSSLSLSLAMFSFLCIFMKDEQLGRIWGWIWGTGVKKREAVFMEESCMDSGCHEGP